MPASAAETNQGSVMSASQGDGVASLAREHEFIQRARDLGLPNLNGMKGILTGASKNIGKAIALTLGASGASLLLNARGEDKLNELVAVLEADGIQAVGMAANVGEPETGERLVSTAVDQLGGLDFVVFNAGTKKDGPMHAIPQGVRDRVMAVNFNGPWDTTQAALKKVMLPRHQEATTLAEAEGRLVDDVDFGAFLYISSDSVRIATSMQSIYVASKRAAEGYFTTSAAEYAQRGIRFNVLRLGYVPDTSLTGSMPEAFKEHFLSETPDHRPVGVLGIGYDAARLVSPASRNTNGQILSINRGIVRG